VEQDDFLNGAVEIETLLPPLELLEELHRLEQNANRERKIHWGPRTLDLDILLYDAEIISMEQLMVPHPDMLNRTFVLEPMAEIAPYLRHPLEGKTMMQLLKELKERTECGA
jgi:dihydroneopterin aldolase/2-amino-4-hydroxy-6-hydroxymethyldihydropteridine diphosphokinase